MRNSPSDAPEVEVGTDFRGAVFDEASSPGSILPGGVAADLDWDDEEESTHVFDRADHDLFGDLESRPSRYGDADDTARRNVASAAALLSKSGGTARPVEIAPPAAAAPPVGFQEIPRPGALPPEAAVPARPDFAPRYPHTPSLAPPAPAASRLPYVLAIVAVIALVVAGVFYFRGPATGDATIHVTSDGKPVDRAQIFVDGQKRCDFSPCVLEGLTPGTKNIRATAGSAVGTQQANIEAGQKHQILIALDVAGTEPEGQPATIKVSAKQKDVKLFVNGEDKGALPAEIGDLKPGTVTLRFEGPEAYGVLERTVELQPGKTLDLGEVTLPLAKVKVTFRLETPGARVWLVTEEDGKKKERELAFGRASKLVETLDTKQPWSIKAEKKGFKPLDKKLAFDGDKEEQDFVVELKAEDEPEPVATAPEPGPGPAPATTDKPEPAPATGQGSLTVNSVPPSKAIVDGRPVGSTPSTVKVSPGSHTVVFIKKGYTRKSKTCKVGAGESKVCAARLKKKD